MIVKIDENSIAYDDVGEGQEIVLIHGFPLSRAMWAPQVGSLVASGYRVLTLDLPGFGESDCMPVHKMSDYADVVAKFMTQMRVRRAVVGGMSMGGYVLLNFMVRFPEKVEAALLIATRAEADDEPTIRKREGMIEDIQSGNRMNMISAFKSVLFGTNPSPDLVVLVESWMSQASDQGLIQGLNAMKSRLDRNHTLQGITPPCWVVTATEDQAISPAYSAVMESKIPNCRLDTIQGAGHMVNLEKSAEFNRLLLEFLSEIFPF